MTPEQEHLFVEVAQFGISCGLEHPFEWYENYVRSLDMMFPSAQVETEENRTTAAFTAFFKGIPGNEGDENTWTEGDFLRAVDSWYAYQRGEQ